MFITKKHLSRPHFSARRVWRHNGAADAEAMTPALNSAVEKLQPLRPVGTVYLPCGIYPDTWHPDALVPAFTLSP